VGLEDRDWYRERPSDAWNHGRSARGRPSSGRLGVRSGAWLAILVSAGAIAVTWKLDVLHIRMPSSDPTTATTQSTSVVQLREVPALRVPAAAPATWTLDTPRLGRIEIPVSAGEIPLDAITRVLNARGLSVSVSPARS
jgi:hypothetical protein